MAVYAQNGEWECIRDTQTALYLRSRDGWLHAVAAFDTDEARDILTQVPQDKLLILRGCPGLSTLAEVLGFNGCNPCYQAVYNKKTPIPIHTELTIRHPDAADFSKVQASYSLADDEELQADFAREDFLGGYLNGELVGYIGVHGEGSMGLLHVFPQYRRRGYAEALYGTLINHQLRKGRLPFAQIVEHNEASLALQRKLGFMLSKERLYWLWRE